MEHVDHTDQKVPGDVLTWMQLIYFAAIAFLPRDRLDPLSGTYELTPN